MPACPPSHTTGELRLPYIPTSDEMENCQYAKKAEAKCSCILVERHYITKIFSFKVDCSTCPHHPDNNFRQ